MVDGQWRRHPSLDEELSLGSGSVQDELREVLQELSVPRKSVKVRKLMDIARRRFHFTAYCIVMLTPIWLLLGTFIYLVYPAVVRLGTLQDALEAYRLSKNVRAVGEALTDEWLASHRYLIHPSNTEHRKLHAAYNRTDELINQSPYLSHCLSLFSLPVSTKEQLQHYLHLFREDEHKIVPDVSTVYNGIVSQMYECGTDTIGRIEIQQNWRSHVCYQHLLSAELHLSELKCILPIACHLKNDTFKDDKVLPVANIASSKLQLAKYFLQDSVWSVNNDSFIHGIFPSKSMASIQFCKEMTDFSNILFNRTQVLTEHHTNRDLEVLSKFRENEYKGTVFFIAIASICFLTGTIAVPVWIFQSSSDCRILTEKTVEMSDMMSEENDRANSVVHKIMPMRFADDTRRGQATAGTQNYDSVTVIYLSIPTVKKLSKACSPLMLVNILTTVMTLLEERISLYKVITLHREGCTYAIASGMNPHCGSSHVTDIANMALDLLISCSDLELDVLPDSRVQLRMGINTGPCIGTVPNQKPLRYCLLGPTVQMAAKLEATCQLSAIHLSKTTAGMLQPRERYSLLKTGNVITMGKVSVESYWLLGRRVSRQTQERQFVREGTSVSSASYCSHVELALKPLYRYDTDENQYVPRTQPLKKFESNRSWLGEAPTGVSHSTDLQIGVRRSVQRDMRNEPPLNQDQENRPSIMSDKQYSNQQDSKVYPTESTFSDKSSKDNKRDTYW